MSLIPSCHPILNPNSNPRSRVFLMEEDIPVTKDSGPPPPPMGSRTPPPPETIHHPPPTMGGTDGASTPGTGSGSGSGVPPVSTQSSGGTVREVLLAQIHQPIIRRLSWPITYCRCLGGLSPESRPEHTRGESKPRSQPGTREFPYSGPQLRGACVLSACPWRPGCFRAPSHPP